MYKPPCSWVSEQYILYKQQQFISLILSPFYPGCISRRTVGGRAAATRSDDRGLAVQWWIRVCVTWRHFLAVAGRDTRVQRCPVRQWGGLLFEFQQHPHQPVQPTVPCPVRAQWNWCCYWCSPTTERVQSDRGLSNSSHQSSLQH